MVEAKDGMVIETNNARVQEARKTMYELLLSNHDKKCLTCARNQDCEFQALGRELGVEDSPYEGERDLKPIDVSESITRDPNKCILCRRCVSVCKNIQTTSILTAENRGFQTVITPAFGLPMGNTACTFCGQCVIVCPVGALRETTHKDRVIQAINDPDKHVVVQPAPAVRVGIGECFGLPAGTCETGKLAAALHRMGFDDVFDTNWGADLTIMEEGTEFLERFRAVISGGVATLPMITSCSPGWARYLEQHAPDIIRNISSCKSPMEMFAAVLRDKYREKDAADGRRTYHVAIMPCTAKKMEAARPEFTQEGRPDVDLVITTRELVDMIREAGIQLTELEPEAPDLPFGLGSGAAVIYGVTGGVAEAVVRYCLPDKSNNALQAIRVTDLRGDGAIREVNLTVEGQELHLAIVNGLSHAKELIADVEAGKRFYHLVEVMTCQGGCVGGAGQPYGLTAAKKRRGAGLYEADSSAMFKRAEKNPIVTRLLEDYGPDRCHELLHVHYGE